MKRSSSHHNNNRFYYLQFINAACRASYDHSLQNLQVSSLLKSLIASDLELCKIMNQKSLNIFTILFFILPLFFEQFFWSEIK
jgi:hypothetical protein